MLMKQRKKLQRRLGFNPSEDDRYKILEMHVNLDLENGDCEDGIAVTLCCNY
jgi:hypothetical protein